MIYCNLATETYPSTPQWLVCPASVSHRLGPGYINKTQRASFYLLFSNDGSGSKDGRTELKNIKHAFCFCSSLSSPLEGDVDAPPSYLRRLRIIKIQLWIALALFKLRNQVNKHINNLTFHGDMKGLPERSRG